MYLESYEAKRQVRKEQDELPCSIAIIVLIMTASDLGLGKKLNQVLASSLVDCRGERE